jgi:hypothetical protein
MKLKDREQNFSVAHHTGGALHHGTHHCHAGGAPVFVVFHKKKCE